MGDTKQKILEVSLDLFSQKGFSAVSIRDICAQVKIKKALFIIILRINKLFSMS